MWYTELPAEGTGPSLHHTFRLSVHTFRPLLFLTGLFGTKDMAGNVPPTSSPTSALPISAKGSSHHCGGARLHAFLRGQLLFLYFHQCSLLVKMIFETVGVWFLAQDVPHFTLELHIAI